MVKKTLYVSPEMEALEIMPEGVLCGSNDLDFNPEEGNM
jgi:hypothetical protein